MARLTAKQQAFCYHYLSNGFNGTRAAIAAGYPEKSAAEIAYENLRKPHIKAFIDAHMKSMAMGAQEVLARLSMQARGDLGAFVGLTAKKIAAHPQAFLLKKFQVVENTDGSRRTTIELYDAQAALIALGKHHGLFVERHEIDIHAEAIRDIREGRVSFEDIAKVDVSLAERLFREAGMAAAVRAGDGTT